MTITDYLYIQAERIPDRTAFFDSKNSFTYKELLYTAEAVATDSSHASAAADSRWQL